MERIGMLSQDTSRNKTGAGNPLDETGPDLELDLAIVGGGFSGLCCAYHLLSQPGLKSSFRSAIIEPGELLGAGVAYRTDSPHHLLNVRARGMSISDSDPGSFVRWLAQAAPEFTPDDFVPRGLYRRYTNDCLSAALQNSHPGALTLLKDEVRALEAQDGSGRYQLRLNSGRTVRARTVVLALGNLPPRTSLDTGLLARPWQHFSGYRQVRRLAIVGAGLTALDVILEAEASGFSGRYWVISPHGQFPRTHHEPHLPLPGELRDWAAELAAARPRLGPLLRAFQQKRKSGVDWQHLVDSFRRHSPAIWSAFDLRDKRLFLRHFRNLWNSHLHRSCHKSMQVVSHLSSTGRLEQVATRVTAVERLAGSGDSAVRLLLQSGAIPALDADLAVNGTGLFSDILATDSPLVAQLIEDRLARPDEFRLGLKVNGTGQLLSAEGGFQPDLFTIGTLRRGAELESTAVPEIRRQVRGMVAEIIRMMAERG
jgi:uncharacterized NAD(P)/FAD-binding protein YdhS